MQVKRPEDFPNPTIIPVVTRLAVGESVAFPILRANSVRQVIWRYRKRTCARGESPYRYTTRRQGDDLVVTRAE